MKARVYGAGLRFGADLTIAQTIRCPTDEAAQEVEMQFKKRKPADIPMLKVLGQNSQVQAIARELVRTFKVEREDKDVTLIATASAEVVRQALDKPR
jgi:hypothetical protein